MRIAGKHQGDIHLLLTDVIMPEMNGHDLARQLFSLYPLMRHLFMSGYTGDFIAHRGVLTKASILFRSHSRLRSFPPNWSRSYTKADTIGISRKRRGKSPTRSSKT
jgi:hypothetical protein